MQSKNESKDLELLQSKKRLMRYKKEDLVDDILLLEQEVEQLQSVVALSESCGKDVTKEAADVVNLFLKSVVEACGYRGYNTSDPQSMVKLMHFIKTRTSTKKKK